MILFSSTILLARPHCFPHDIPRQSTRPEPQRPSARSILGDGPRGNPINRDWLRREIIPRARYRRDRAALMSANRTAQSAPETIRARAGTKPRDDCGPWQRGCAAAWERAMSPEPLHGVGSGKLTKGGCRSHEPNSSPTGVRWQGRATKDRTAH